MANSELQQKSADRLAAAVLVLSAAGLLAVGACPLKCRAALWLLFLAVLAVLKRQLCEYLGARAEAAENPWPSRSHWSLLAALGLFVAGGVAGVVSASCKGACPVSPAAAAPAADAAPKKAEVAKPEPAKRKKSSKR